MYDFMGIYIEDGWLHATIVEIGTGEKDHLWCRLDTDEWHAESGVTFSQFVQPLGGLRERYLETRILPGIFHINYGR